MGHVGGVRVAAYFLSRRNHVGQLVRSHAAGCVLVNTAGTRKEEGA